MSFTTPGARGALQLLAETDPASEMIRRAVRLEAAPDGRSVLLVDVDSRKPGIHREIRYEITPAELVAVIRAQGSELPGECHAGDRGQPDEKSPL